MRQWEEERLRIQRVDQHIQQQEEILRTELAEENPVKTNWLQEGF